VIESLQSKRYRCFTVILIRLGSFWRIKEGSYNREFKFSKFCCSLCFMTKVAMPCGEGDINPDGSMFYNKRVIN